MGIQLPIWGFDQKAIEAVIAAAELQTDGEVRVCIERRTVADMDMRAREVFEKLGMTKTKKRNGVLLYVHLREKKLVILGDSGINTLVDPTFWQQVCSAVLACFIKNNMTIGVILGIMMVTEQLKHHFPLTAPAVNSLPNYVAKGEHI